MATQNFYTLRQNGVPLGAPQPQQPPPMNPQFQQPPQQPQPQLHHHHQQQQRQQQPWAQHSQTPRRHGSPPRLSEESDIRQERLTEAEMRERLSEYRIFRFKKVDDSNDFDDEGYRREPTWDNCRREEVTDLTKEVATRHVRKLDEELEPEGQSVLDKKSSLIPAQQRQVEKAQEELSRLEPDPRYRFILAQLDWTRDLKSVNHAPVEEGLGEQYWRDKDRSGKDKRSKDKKKSKDTDKDKRYKDKRYKDKKDKDKKDKGEKEKRVKVYQTSTITAFYKRQPKPDAPIQAMYLEKFQQQQQPLARPVQNMVHHMQQPQQHQIPGGNFPAHQHHPGVPFPQNNQGAHMYPLQHQHQQQQHQHQQHQQHQPPPQPPRAKTPVANNRAPVPPPTIIQAHNNTKPKTKTNPAKAAAVKVIKPAGRHARRQKHYSSDSDYDSVSDDMYSVGSSSSGTSMSSGIDRRDHHNKRGGRGRTPARDHSRGRNRSRHHGNTRRAVVSHSRSRSRGPYRAEHFGEESYRQHVKPQYGTGPVASPRESSLYTWPSTATAAAAAAIQAPPPKPPTPPPTERSAGKTVPMDAFFDVVRQNAELGVENRILRSGRIAAAPSAPASSSSAAPSPRPATAIPLRPAAQRPMQRPTFVQTRPAVIDPRYDDSPRGSRLSFDEEHAYGGGDMPSESDMFEYARDFEHAYPQYRSGARHVDREPRPYPPPRRPEEETGGYHVPAGGGGRSSSRRNVREYYPARRPASPPQQNPFRPLYQQL